MCRPPQRVGHCARAALPRCGESGSPYGAILLSAGAMRCRIGSGRSLPLARRNVFRLSLSCATARLVSFADVRKRLRSAPLTGCTPSAARGCSPRPALGAPAPSLWARGAPAPPRLRASLTLRPPRGRGGYGRAVVGGYAPSFSFGCRAPCLALRRSLWSLLRARSASRFRGAFSRCRGVSLGSPASPTRGSLRLSSSRATERHSRPTSRERKS